MKFSPLNDRILVRRIAAETTTASGLVIPEQAQEKLNEGEVLAVGPGKLALDGTRITPALSKGQRVLFAKYSGTVIKVIDGLEHIVMGEDDILGVTYPDDDPRGA